jgi:hypothetical protein
MGWDIWSSGKTQQIEKKACYSVYSANLTLENKDEMKTFPHKQNLDN